MKRFVTAARSAVAFLFVSLMFTAMAEVTPDDYAKKLTITLSDAVGEGELENFPVLVRLSESIQGFKYADFKEDGADMIFTDEAGNLLSHEIDTWDASGTSLVWVKIPSAQAGVKIVCYFGGPSAAETVDPTAVWSNYTGVWHMGDTKQGTYNETEYTMFPNATGLADTEGLLEPKAAKANAEGTVGSCVDLGCTDVNKKYGGVYIKPSDGLGMSGSFSFSLWLKTHEGKEVSWWRMTSNRPGAVNVSAGKGFGIDCKSGSQFKVYSSGDGKMADYLTLTTAFSSSRWTQLVFVFKGSSLTLYQDGVQVGSSPFSIGRQIEASDALWGIGNVSDGIRGEGSSALFQGFCDELRVSTDEFTAERVAAEYAAVAKPEVLTYGHVEDLGVVYYPINLTVPSGSVSFSVDPHHYQDEVPYFLSGTELTITATDETALRFRKWFGDTEGATVDGNNITVLVLQGMSLAPLWKRAWQLASDRKTMTDCINTLVVTTDASTGWVTVMKGDATAILDPDGEVDLSLPIVGPTGQQDFWYLKGVGKEAFYKNTDVMRAILPDTKATDEKQFTNIGENAFRDCTNLKTVTPLLPVTVSSLGARAFNTCSALQGDLRLECPTLTKNPSYGFQNSSAITSIYLPYIVDMQSWVYSALGSVTNITLSVNKIDFNDASPFSGLTTKCEVYFPGKAPVFTSGDRPFGKGVKGLVIYCDPVIDPKGWAEVETLNWVNPTNPSKWFKFVKVADDPTMTTDKDYPGPKTIGRFMGEDGSSGEAYNYWLVAYKSPFRKPGLLLLVR